MGHYHSNVQQKLAVRYDALAHVSDTRCMLELGAGDGSMYAFLYRDKISTGITVDNDPDACALARTMRPDWHVFQRDAFDYVASQRTLPELTDIDLFGSAARLFALVAQRAPDRFVVVYHHCTGRGRSFDKTMRAYDAHDITTFLRNYCVRHGIAIVHARNETHEHNHNGYVVCSKLAS